MIKQLDKQSFAIDFSAVRRPGGNWLTGLFARPAAVEVDAFAVGHALRAVLGFCTTLDVEGRLQVWNDYRLFLCRDDYEALRKKAPTLQGQLGPALEEQVLKMNASYIGTPMLRVHEDESREVEPGHGVLHVDWSSEPPPAAAKGEVTVRLDKVAPGPSGALGGIRTERAGSAVLRHPQGQHALAGGVTYRVGRGFPGAGPDHLAIPGASGRINKRQVNVRIDEGAPPTAVVTREAGDSNPVSVNGQPLPAGQSIKVNLPAELLLSGELKLELHAC